MSIAEPFDYRISPQDVAAILRAQVSSLIWLDSASNLLGAGVGAGRWSYLVADPALLLIGEPGVTHIRTGQGKQQRGATLARDPLSICELILSGAEEVVVQASDVALELPPFRGGLAGYCGYDFGAALHGVTAESPPQIDVPQLQFGWYDWVLAWDHASLSAWIVVRDSTPSAVDLVQLATAPDATGASLRRKRVNTQKVSAMLRSVLAQTVRDDDVLSYHRLSSRRMPGSMVGVKMDPGLRRDDVARRDNVDDAPPEPLRSNFTRDGYIHAVSRVRELILDGDIFQANISQSFTAGYQGSAWQLYCDLREETRAPYGAYIELPNGAILSASPEMFLHLNPAGQVESRPIKGTRPRGATPAEEARYSRELLASEKDRAENLMIVDLLRNDLSRVCEPGSVYVAALFEVERWATVQHLVSSVRGHLRQEQNAIALFRAAFPGGSITGAPKVRAMQIISLIEGSGRGAYCGSIGFFAADGEMLLSIAIRTLTLSGGVATFAGGGGIVLDSDPASEYDETLVKVDALVRAITDTRVAAPAGIE